MSQGVINEKRIEDKRMLIAGLNTCWYIMYLAAYQNGTKAPMPKDRQGAACLTENTRFNRMSER